MIPKKKRKMKYCHTPKGTCSTRIEVEVDAGVIQSVTFTGGCHGNLQAVARLVTGLEPSEAIKKLKGIECGQKGTSCPDQLCEALEAMGYSAEE